MTKEERLQNITLIFMYICQEVLYFLLVYFLLTKVSYMNFKGTEKCNHPLCLAEENARNIAFYNNDTGTK